MRKKSVLNFSAWLWVAGTILCEPSLAQKLDQMKKFDQYNIYYNVINSTFLAPEVADRYDLPREEDVAVLTISVRAQNEEGEMTDQPSQVSGAVRDLIHLHELDFEEFRDPNAVYYIAEVPAEGRVALDFSIDIKPKDSAEVYELEFSEMLYPPVSP